ncbi:hypothetical protein JCM16303_006265 [Sporobolomyces ruberrimus]
MGSSSSTPVATMNTSEKNGVAQPQRVESAAELLAQLSLRSSAPASSTGQVTSDLISTWQDSFSSSAKNRLASTVLSKTNWTEAIINNSTVVKDTQVFNTKLSLEGAPVTNQKSSGRCWLFAMTNLVRIEASSDLCAYRALTKMA